jgi:amino acid transporter
MSESLRRELRLYDVVAIGINGIIGTGIFFLPGEAAALLGPAALLTFLIAAATGMAMVFCLAEVGSRFRGTGGPMRYAQAAFGDVAGFSVGWMALVTRFAAWGALANAMVTAVDVLVPGAAEYRTWILCGLFGGLALVNSLGIQWTALVTNFFTLAKLLPLVFFIAVGISHIDTSLYRPFAPQGYGNLGAGTLLIFFAFAGFELLPVAAGEMKSPRKSVPAALFIVMSLVTVVYLAIWVVCAGTLPSLAGSASPVSDAAAMFLGPSGALLVSVGILMSVLGVNIATSLSASRFLYALGAAGQMPRFFGRVHARTQAPIAAIVTTAAITLVIALSGSFVELAVLSVVARFTALIPSCIAVLVFRRQRPDEEPGFRVPFGPTIPLVALALCVWILAQAEGRQLFWGAVALVIGWIFYATARFAGGGNLSADR